MGMIRQDSVCCLVFLVSIGKLSGKKRNGDAMLGFLIALLSGALMSVQGVFNTQVTKTSGIWVANTFVQFTALLVCLAAWLATDRSSFGSLFKVEPKYMLLGGYLLRGCVHDGAAGIRRPVQQRGDCGVCNGRYVHGRRTCIHQRYCDRRSYHFSFAARYSCSGIHERVSVYHYWTDCYCGGLFRRFRKTQEELVAAGKEK